MWLLDTGFFQLEEFIGDQIPKYAILSHTWDEEEVSFQDMQDFNRAHSKAGFQKLLGVCKRAKADGFRWIWIDTCCIDKSSSAELSEAINSMYKFYNDAQICYVYLADVQDNRILDLSQDQIFHLLGGSRWFSRGWTLQELIAPPIVEFYSAGWLEIGTKLSLIKDISLITGIDEGVLRGTKEPTDFNVACRMSWAAGRETTRLEDRAYSLLGIFQVNMPLLYGEGSRAFRRLQEEIMKLTEDYTIFTWTWPSQSDETTRAAQYCGSSLGILASSPDRFDPQMFQSLCHQPYSSFEKSTKSTLFERLVVQSPCPGASLVPPTLTSRGLSINVLVIRKPKSPQQSQEEHLCLSWYNSAEESLLLCLSLAPAIQPTLNDEHPLFTRPRLGSSRWLYFLHMKDLKKAKFEYRTIHWIPTPKPPVPHEPNNQPVVLSLSTNGDCRITAHLLPSASVSLGTNTFKLGWLLRYFRTPAARAVFAVDCTVSPELTAHFIIAFGFVGRRIPICGILQTDLVVDGKSEEPWGFINNVLNRRNEAKAYDLAYADLRPALIKSVSEQGKYNASKGVDWLTRFSKLLDEAKDRAGQKFDGGTIKVAARRQFGQDTEQYDLEVTVQYQL
ncbi:uncharacterized protein PV07_08381 [Cladophialophora immunda]|uniref:Uncharacterized protein n=1 Tax=Cladophialophora immunda TaxID=569365 RepID=A0A0D2CCC1_9EURO|nr:uncharacterized protein PV07_08381 [Cladophialophora immunda]KIW28743.1 hypothetical protein PV07_08381 [Cladophialophora immunda]OQV04370.1 hypothetical protein CLAIMM_09262 [Cladophialophora immunda]